MCFRDGFIPGSYGVYADGSQGGVAKKKKVVILGTGRDLWWHSFSQEFEGTSSRTRSTALYYDISGHFLRSYMTLVLVSL